jgi:hypothetical protein
MLADFASVSKVHKSGESATHPIAPLALRLALFLLLADMESASSSRLAKRCASGTLGRVQLPNPR